MFEINKEYGVYYGYNYYPKRRYGWTEESQKILDYKDGKENAVEEMTDDFSKIIASITNKSTNPYVALVAVPTSKVNKTSSVRKSITRIAKRYGRTFDCGDMLVRNTNILSAHEAGGFCYRPTRQMHIDTISFNKPEVFGGNITYSNTTFILMDDVCTLGTQLSACEEILMKNGVPPQNIKKVVLAKTVPLYYKK